MYVCMYVCMYVICSQNKGSPSLSRANKRYSWQPSVDSTSSDHPILTPPTSTHHIPSSSSLTGLAELRRERLEKVHTQNSQKSQTQTVFSTFLFVFLLLFFNVVCVMV